MSLSEHGTRRCGLDLLRSAILCPVMQTQVRLSDSRTKLFVLLDRPPPIGILDGIDCLQDTTENRVKVDERYKAKKLCVLRAIRYLAGDLNIAVAVVNRQWPSKCDTELSFEDIKTPPDKASFVPLFRWEAESLW